MNVLTGALAPDAGRLLVAGEEQTGAWSAAASQNAGIRCEFQELSLCDNLSVSENTRFVHGSLRGRRRNKRGRALSRSKRDDIFPGLGIFPVDEVADLPIGKRQ